MATRRRQANSDSHAAVGPSSSSATRSVSMENPTANISGSTINSAPASAACSTIGSSRASEAVRSSQQMSHWTAASRAFSTSPRVGSAGIEPITYWE